MNTLTLSLRRLTTHREELPAFRAAYVILLALAASLFHLGAFAALIGFHVFLDIYKYTSLARCTTLRGIALAIRESLLDLTLLLFALTASVYLSSALSSVADLTGLLRSGVTTMRGLATFLPKLVILRNFVVLLSDVPSHLSDISLVSKRKIWLPQERMLALVAAALLSLLALATVVLGVSFDAFLQIVERALSIRIL